MNRDDSLKEEEVQNYIDILEEAQKKLSDVVLPSMGLIDNEKDILIDGKDYIKNNND